jgi:hypothetical protein
MALVRCPIHKIPYNDENPRGCPACAREKGGADQSDVMKELARVSRSARGNDKQHLPEPLKDQPQVTWTITPQPKEAADSRGPLTRVLDTFRERPALGVAVALLPVLLVVAIATSGPRFVPAIDPPPYAGSVRPLPIEPGQPISAVFAMLGTQAPRSVPGAERLARYSYGTDLYIDAINERVYAITVGVSNRTWRGLSVGAPERTVTGTLALLGAVREGEAASVAPPLEVSGYHVYQSLDSRPRRLLRVAVRPPNGCFDAEVDLRPQTVGLLLKGDERYAVLGKGSDVEPEWVTTQIRVVDRRVAGPLGNVACF